MNHKHLTREEAVYLIFAIKKTLRDRDVLTPGMEQFYDTLFDNLKAKVKRIDSARKDGRSLLDDKRARNASVPNPWLGY